MYLKFHRRMAEEPMPGRGSRVILDELDQIGACAAKWVDDHAPDAVWTLIFSELQTAVGHRLRTGKKGSALRVLEASTAWTRALSA